MLCDLCGVQEPREETVFHLLPATDDMREMLAGLLAEHGIFFEKRSNLITLAGPGDHVRELALLRQLLSGPERQAVSVFRANGKDFPVPRPLDDWWRVFETGWFEDAMAHKRFVTWFQPIVNSGEHTVMAHECLIRLPAGRMFEGAEIVNAAHIHAETRAFDSHARILALQAAAAQSGGGLYFINFTAASIYNPASCLQATIRAVEESGLRPENIVFEAAGSDLLGDTGHLRRVADYLRRHGFGFSLDDIGTGAEGFQAIRDLRPDYFKIDRQLIRNIERPTSASAVRRLVDLADRFEAVPVAKGVEAPQTMEDLWLLGVQCMQGYLFGRPGPKIFTPERDLFNLARALEDAHAPLFAAVH